MQDASILCLSLVALQMTNLHSFAVAGPGRLPHPMDGVVALTALDFKVSECQEDKMSRKNKKRKNPSPSLRDHLLAINANRCCVCKACDVGLELHHIDGNSANTVGSNLAVLCVRDHDHHHHPHNYRNFNHLELGRDEITRLKSSWEAFVHEARQDAPKILATVTGYGTERHVHSAELVMQWADNHEKRIEYRKVYTLRTGSFDMWTTDIVKEALEVGKNIRIALVNKPDTDEQCPTCGVGLSRTVDEEHALKATDQSWKTDTILSIFLFQDKPAIDAILALRDRELLDIRIHLCAGTHIHVLVNDWESRYRITKHPSVRAQVARIVGDLKAEWEPAKLLFGTGDSKNSRMLSWFKLPRIWEERVKTIAD